jgi:glycogen debranching enzyme
VRPGFLFFLITAVLTSQDLPKRFPIPDTEPSVAKDVHGAKFAEAVGRRAALLGREDGTFEAWINPVKVLRDFRLSVYFDGALEPVPLADLAERVIAGPGRTTIIHSHAAFTIRQHWIAPIDRPALIVLLEIDCDRSLKIRASFLPELKPMWPASFGGQSSSWIGSERLFVLGEGLRQHAAVIGSPAFVRSSEQVGHQLPDRTVLVEMDVTPEMARTSLLPIIITESRGGAAAARKIYHETLASIESLMRESDDYYREFASRTFKIDTPVPELNRAFDWAKYAVEKGWACNEGVGCGLVAGYGASGASERPGFDWYFGGDALMNSWSILDYGDFSRARGVLGFVRDHQRADGKMMHELTQSAALLDWSKYPYGYYHGDTTPLFLYAAAEYVTRSGDVDFLRDSWAAIDRAYRFCTGTLDADGLMSNKKAGTAAVETGALSGRVQKDVYLAGVWLAGLDGYRRLAEAGGHAREARDAQSRLSKGRDSLNKWFLQEKGWLPFGHLTDGSIYDAQSSWQAFALAYGGLDPERAQRAAATLIRPELSTNWGTRLFATDSPNYDPLGYNDGSVWPFVTGFVINAEFRHHQEEAGLRHLFGVAATTGWAGAGFIAEYMSGDRAQVLPRAVPHQLFSSSSILRGAVGGLLGLEGDALGRTLRFAPHIPFSWKFVRFENYRVGESVVAGEMENGDNFTRVRISVSGPSLDVTVSPAFPLDVKLTGLRGNGLQPQPAETGADLHIPVTVGQTQLMEVTYDVTFDTPPAPVVLKAPEIGDRGR